VQRAGLRFVIQPVAEPATTVPASPAIASPPRARAAKTPAQTRLAALGRPAAARSSRSAARRAPRPAVPAMPAVRVAGSGIGAAALRYALAHLGAPYRYGADGPEAFDCSGLVLAAYASAGVHLPHKAAAFYGVGRPVDRGQLQPGDILVLDGGGHAALYVGGGMMVHAPHTGDVVRVAPISGFSAARRLG
jgi:peptidoglycan DL-endopeptidase CwlO